MIIAQTLLPDPGQWTSVTDWADQPAGPDSAHYHAPASYMFYTLRLVMLASMYSMLAMDQGIDFEERIRLFATANGILEAAMLVISRPDVQSVIPREPTLP
jgi:hypothetical protein